jgi:hypothetical protein
MRPAAVPMASLAAGRALDGRAPSHARPADSSGPARAFPTRDPTCRRLSCVTTIRTGTLLKAPSIWTTSRPYSQSGRCPWNLGGRSWPAWSVPNCHADRLPDGQGRGGAVKPCLATPAGSGGTTRRGGSVGAAVGAPMPKPTPPYQFIAIAPRSRVDSQSRLSATPREKL